MRKLRIFLLSVSLFLLSHFSIYSIDFYKKGDFQLGLRVPLSIPAFTANVGSDPVTVLSFWDTGYKNIIAGLELDIGVFTSSKTSMGGILGYNFAYDRGYNLFSKVPLLFKANYFIDSSYKQDVLLSLAAGVNYFKYRSMEHIVPEISAEVGFNIYWSESWSGLFRTGINTYFELYANSEKNNISATIPIVLGVSYRK